MLIKDSVWLHLFIPGVTSMWVTHAKFQITKSFKSLHSTLFSIQETRKKYKKPSPLIRASNVTNYVQRFNSQFGMKFFILFIGVTTD